MVIWFLDSDFFPRAAKIPLNKHVLFPQFFVSHLKKHGTNSFPGCPNLTENPNSSHTIPQFFGTKKGCPFFFEKKHTSFFLRESWSRPRLEHTPSTKSPPHPWNSSCFFDLLVMRVVLVCSQGYVGDFLESSKYHRSFFVLTVEALDGVRQWLYEKFGADNPWGIWAYPNATRPWRNKALLI